MNAVLAHSDALPPPGKPPVADATALSAWDVDLDTATGTHSSGLKVHFFSLPADEDPPDSDGRVALTICWSDDGFPIWAVMARSEEITTLGSFGLLNEPRETARTPGARARRRRGLAARAEDAPSGSTELPHVPRIVDVESFRALPAPTAHMVNPLRQDGDLNSFNLTRGAGQVGCSVRRWS